MFGALFELDPDGAINRLGDAPGRIEVMLAGDIVGFLQVLLLERV